MNRRDERDGGCGGSQVSAKDGHGVRLRMMLNDHLPRFLRMIERMRAGVNPVLAAIAAIGCFNA